MHQFGLSQLKGSTENNSKVVDAEPQSVDTEIVSLEGFTPSECGSLLPLSINRLKTWILSVF